MTKIITTVVLTLFAIVMSWAQNPFQKFEGNENITSVVINKKMFELMGRVKMDGKDKNAQDFLNLVKKLDAMKVFVASDLKMIPEMKATSEKYLKTAQLEELMSINDGGKKIRILVKSGAKESQIKELFMFIEGNAKEPETVIMSLTGLFDLDEISLLSDKMNLPAGEQIKKATQKKK
jgi:hypothetical protein